MSHGKIACSRGVVSGASRNLKVIAQTSDVRIGEYTLNSGDSHPRHHHSQVMERMHCLEGLIGLDTRQPAHQFLLGRGKLLGPGRNGSPREQSGGRHWPVSSRPGVGHVRLHPGRVTNGCTIP